MLWRFYLTFYYLEKKAKTLVRWKLLQYIIPTKEIPMQRKIDNINQCHLFGVKKNDHRKVNYTNEYAVIDPVSITMLMNIVYQYFNQPDHSILPMRVRIIEPIYHRTKNTNLATPLSRQKGNIQDDCYKFVFI
jgi:hypothetical protein